MPQGFAEETLADSSEQLTENSPYERNKKAYMELFKKMIPNQITIQYAGSIGLLSYGFGWHYGKKLNWETDVLVGHVPKYNSNQSKTTLTLKQRYIPWHVRLGSRWHVHPLTTGLYFNSIFGEDFWASQPSRYPKKYYGFATKVRAGFYVGGRLYYKFAHKDRKFMQGVSLYYELGAGDLQIISALPNKNVRLTDILSLGLGVTFDIF